jgi:ABC-type branched-subunit amino acid transport system substrate-binding protein
MVSPDDQHGQVGALIAMLEKFQWHNIHILTTDTVYSLDISTAFQNLWKHDISYTATIRLLPEDIHRVDPESVLSVLKGMPNDPKIKARVVLLLAHDTHAYSILEMATREGFRPEAIWIGPQAWVGLEPPTTSWMRDVPGYLGISPYRNQDQHSADFLQAYQEYQKAHGIQPVWSALPEYYAVDYTVDSIVAMTMALSNTPSHLRRNASHVSTQLRALNFSGVSGPVSFTTNGDRQDPLFTIYNLQKDEDGSYRWIDVGRTGITLDSATLDDGITGICFAKVGCRLEAAPSDSYPVPMSPITLSFIVVGPLIFALFVFASVKYFRSKGKKKKLKEDLANQAQDVKQLKENLIHEALNADEKIKKEKEARNALVLERGKMERPDTWTIANDKILVELAPEDEEYWTVASNLRETMPNSYISKLWRVQNIDLWSYYLFHKDRFARTVGDVTEREVWHGTSHIDPEMIYNDSQDGFMVQFARDGLFGYVKLVD